MTTRPEAGRRRDGVGGRARGAARVATGPAAVARSAAAAVARSAATAAVVVAAVALAAAGVLLSPVPADGQQQDPGAEAAGAAQERPSADPADVESIDAIVAALYDLISGGKGEARDWDRLRSLMYPGAVLMPNFPEEGEGPQPMSVEEFVEWAEQAIQEQGFYESEVDRTVQRYGPVAHVWSTYESRNAPDEEPFVRGINSIQLVHDGSRWWVAHIAWTDVTEAGPIPERYGGDG